VKPAVFFDRDGTVIELVHHLTDPKKVRLLPHAGEALRELRRHGYACVLVTNQSVIGRGMLTMDGLGAVHAELLRQLADRGAELDGFYFCPVVPAQTDVLVVEHPDRKPGPGMLLRAAAELDLDLKRSWMVGDSISDMLAGRNAGCRGTILVRTAYSPGLREPEHLADYTADHLWAAVEIIMKFDSIHDSGA
jgi:D-glycero-D-manno-heptose 1,7-bisphosphate phosphatase